MDEICRYLQDKIKNKKNLLCEASNGLSLTEQNLEKIGVLLMELIMLEDANSASFL